MLSVVCWHSAKLEPPNMYLLKYQLLCVHVLRVRDPGSGPNLPRTFRNVSWYILLIIRYLATWALHLIHCSTSFIWWQCRESSRSRIDNDGRINSHQKNVSKTVCIRHWCVVSLLDKLHQLSCDYGRLWSVALVLKNLFINRSTDFRVSISNVFILCWGHVWEIGGTIIARGVLEYRSQILQTPNILIA